MTLRAASGGWINTDFENMEESKSMITQERKSKFKHKITISYKNTPASESGNREHEMRQWCEDSYGPGGRKHRWRFGWIENDRTFYFKSSKDAMMFTLRWSS